MFVLTLNEGGSDNLGDQAISKSLSFLLEKNDCRVERCDFTGGYYLNDIHYTIKKKHKSALKSFIFNLFKRSHFIIKLVWLSRNISKIISVASKRYDYAFIGGGQLILSNGIFPIAMFLWVVVLRFFKTNVFIVGVGVGNDFSGLNKFLFKISINLCESVLLRDKESINKMSEVFDIKAGFIPDLAFYYSIVANGKEVRFKTSEKSLIVGIIDYSIYKRYSKEMSRNIKSEREYIEQWADEVMGMTDQITDVKLVVTSKEDLRCSRMLYDTLSSKDIGIRLELINFHMNLTDYFDLLKSSDIVFSARMHSLILAQSLGCKIVPWLVSKKLEFYIKEYANQSVEDLQTKIQCILFNLLL
jgi:polysaccharide pyruvyl transferase WcaK-like protein